MVKYKMKQTALLIVLLLSIGWIKADAMNDNRIHCVVLNTQGNPIPSNQTKTIGKHAQ